MNLYYIIGLVLVIIICLSYAIPLVTSNSIETFSPSKKIVFTAYTAEWCPHCVEFNSNIYGKLVDKFNGSPNVKINNVDCTDDRSGNTKTIGGNIINGFPTLMINVYHNGKMNEIQYDGNRRFEDIVSFINNL